MASCQARPPSTDGEWSHMGCHHHHLDPTQGGPRVTCPAPERTGSKVGRGSPAATPGLGKSGPHWGWARSPKLSEGEKPGQEGGNKGEEMTG